MPSSRSKVTEALKCNFFFFFFFFFQENHCNIFLFNNIFLLLFMILREFYDTMQYLYNFNELFSPLELIYIFFISLLFLINAIFHIKIE